MKEHKLLRFIPIFFFFASCGTIRYFQPDIANGGRAVAIAAHPTDNSKFFVASETGGLFKSTDGGAKWQHVPMPTFVFGDVKYFPANSNILIAVSGADLRTNSGGGIYRSTDGGATWVKPASATPSTPCIDRFGASCIAFEPGTNRIFVGHSCGMAVSSDQGVTWTHLKPRSSNNGVSSILALGGGRLGILLNNGFHFSNNDGTTWTRFTTGPGWHIAQGPHNQLAVSPLNTDHLFWALNYWDTKWHAAIFRSTDGGRNWTAIKDVDYINRPPFVKTALTTTGHTGRFDIYHGDGGSLFRATGDATGAMIGGWITLGIDHADPADLGFRTDGRIPSLLATDGGLHSTTNMGANWTFTGGGKNGYNALQITEVTGQYHPDDSHTDLYFGTQDNDIWASADGGSTWPTRICCEGFFLNVPPISYGHTDSKVTGVTCGACGNFITNEHLSGFNWFSNPPNDRGNPALITPGVYVQNSGPSGSTTNTYQLTMNHGSTWTPKFSFSEPPMDLPKIVGSSSSSVIFIPVKKPGTTADGNEKIGIKRITGILGIGSPTVSDVPDFGSLGIFATMFAWYKPFGVNPTDPNHLIVPDIESNTMKVTYDGGITWNTDAPLTQLITNSGEFKFREGPFLQFQAIAFDPKKPWHIVIGTHQAGVIRSFDGGRNWEKIAGTETITNISSFYFRQNKDCVVVSTYGRGLFCLCYDVPSRFIPIPFPIEIAVGGPWIRDPGTGVWIQIKDLGDPEICPACIYLFNRNGEITDIQFDKDFRVKKISLSKGSLVGYNNNKEQIQATTQTEISEKYGNFSDNPFFKDRARSKHGIKGLILEGDILKGVIFSDREIEVNINPIARLDTVPRLRLLGASLIGGTPTLALGDRIRLQGNNFQKDIQGLWQARIEIDGIDVSNQFQEMKANDQGELQMDLNYPFTLGPHKILVEQITANGVIREVITFNVVVSDEREKKN